MAYVIQVCRQLASRIRTERPDPARKLYDMICMTYTSCCVYSGKLLMMDGGTVRNMQSFIPKIKINLRN